MNKYDKYIECIQDDIDKIMENKMKDLKSLELLHSLIDMKKHLKEESDKYNKMVESGEIKEPQKEWEDVVTDSHVDERIHGMLHSFKLYKDYKTMYRKTNKEEDKKMMLQELKNIIEQHELIVKEIMSCGLDCQEEKMFIKEFLQKTYRSVS